MLYRWLIILLILLVLAYCSVRPLRAAAFVPEGDIVGVVTRYQVEEKDNLYEIARRFDIGIVELLAANPGIDPWMPKAGTELTITSAHILPPDVREGIVINLSELRLFYFAKNGSVMTFPIGIGQEGWQTPVGKTRIASKRKNPAWIPPASIREEDPELPDIIPAGPDNPLGEYALYLDWKKFLIHGTNRPYGVGKRSSHGCIRLYPEDIETLFNAVDIGTKVTIIDTPYKLGWKGEVLYLEVTPTQEQSDAIANYRRPFPLSIPEIYDHIRASAGNTNINWYEADHAIAKRSGIPVEIGRSNK